MDLFGYPSHKHYNTAWQNISETFRRPKRKADNNLFQKDYLHRKNPESYRRQPMCK